jgi:Fe-S-cluster containining protein
MKKTTHSATGGRNRRLTKNTFCFDCHPGVACFTRCCKDTDMYLYPYDVIRMKSRLGITSDRFLEQYTFQAIRDNPYFPSLMLKMTDNKEKWCPFLSTKGCGIYEDRPFSCRSYPLERAVARTGDESQRTVLYFIAEDTYCKGHEESREWTIKEWIEDQQIQLYNDMNDLWVDIDTLFRANPWGPQGIDNPALKMAFMACFNIDEFKRFVFESTFLSRFNVHQDKASQLWESDIELMTFGLDWIKYFLTGKGPLRITPSKDAQI